MESADKTASRDPARARRGVNPFRPLGNWPPGYILLWALTLISLVLNSLLLRQLLLARNIARQSVQDSIAVIEGLQTQVIEYNFIVDQALPLRTDIPIQTTLDIRLQEEFPINTTVTISVPTPLGDLPVRVPISTVVPIDRTVHVNVDEVFPIDTSIPVYFEVPISVAIADTPLFATLEETKARLLLLEQSLNAPLLPFLDGEPQPTEPAHTPTPIRSVLPTPATQPGITTTPPQ